MSGRWCERLAAPQRRQRHCPDPVVESRGRSWLFINHELKAVNLRLGISDGTNTELLSGERGALIVTEHGAVA